jgi:hypothetical protein
MSLFKWREMRNCGQQGSQNRWEPVRFGRFPVEPVRPGTRTGPVPTLKPCLIFLTLDEPVGLTGIPAGFLNRGNRTSHGSVNPGGQYTCESSPCASLFYRSACAHTAWACPCR